MSMRSWAREELKLAKFEEEETEALMTMLNIFFTQYDSGGAVHAMIPVFHRLLCGRPLTPLTGEDSEWFEPDPNAPCLMNRRCYHVFRAKMDIVHLGLKIGDSWDDTRHQTGTPVKKITFPYMPGDVDNIDSPVFEIAPRSPLNDNDCEQDEGA